VTNYQTVTGTNTGSGDVTATASCPGGTTLLGGGATDSAATSQLTTRQSGPTSSTAWTATINRNVAGTHTVTVTIFCATFSP
jgi:hypothetical protein